MTPFGRQPITAGLLATHALAEDPAPAAAVDKWTLLRDLTTARVRFGISDRDLMVLSALLSFHPARLLDDTAALIVFPSNATLSHRAHGMAESTLRRHLAALVKSGLILRRDSPNGKRYARRSAAGVIDRAFGFDLRPLLVRAPDIADAAKDITTAQHELRCLRESVVIRLRDLTKLIHWTMTQTPQTQNHLHTDCATLHRHLRRKLSLDELRILNDRIERMIDDISRELTAVNPPNASEMGGNDSQNERHYQNSDKDSSESDVGHEEIGISPPALPLDLVLKAAPEIITYAMDPVRNWHDFIRLSAFVAPMMGITRNVWQDACDAMGEDTAAVTLACLLQRGTAIASPGAYLRSLTGQARKGAFSSGPMVMALIRAENRQPL